MNKYTGKSPSKEKSVTRITSSKVHHINGGLVGVHPCHFIELNCAVQADEFADGGHGRACLRCSWHSSHLFRAERALQPICQGACSTSRWESMSEVQLAFISSFSS